MKMITKDHSNAEVSKHFFVADNRSVIPSRDIIIYFPASCSNSIIDSIKNQAVDIMLEFSFD